MGAAASAQTQMQQEHDPNAIFPWWVRFLAKGLGVVGGFVAIFFAILGFFTFDAECIVAVLLQLLFGLLMVALEAPFCCMFVDFIERIANFSESRKFWQKGLLYIAFGLIPMLICFELNTFLGGALIVASGATYGFMALGKKADRSTMMASAAGGVAPGDHGAWDSNVGQQNVPHAFGQP